MDANRAQLNDYFASELEGLRTRAIEFAKENPSIAEELMFSQQNEGRSRDPHIEILIQSFAWLTSRLRQNIESESSKLPSILLQQLYPQLICSTPSMAIAECKVNGFAADFNNGYLLQGQLSMEPVNINASSEDANKLRQCKMSTCHDSVLWPLKTTNIQHQAINVFPKLALQFPKAQSVININIEETDKGAAEGISFKRPLRFFINLAAQSRFQFYDFIAKNFVGAAIMDNAGNQLLTLTADDLKLCGFEDNERLFPEDNYQDLGFSLLQDYFNFPEKFMFFELKGLDKLVMSSPIELKLIFNESMPKALILGEGAIKLNCVPVINLFEKTTEPLPIHYKDYRYRLYPSRENYDSFEIIKVNKLYSVNKNGESNELHPYFCLDNNEIQESNGCQYRWLVQQETSHRKQLAGTETWLSLYDVDFNNASPIGETVYAKTQCSNRSVCELFPKQQGFSIIGSSPVTEVTLLTRPTRHKGSNLQKEHLWKILSHLSVYYVSLADPKLAKDMLVRFLTLYTNKGDPVSQRQIESIEKLTVCDDVQPHITDGWRGYYRGTKFSLTLTERKFDGSSTILFSRVIHQFLALFCHVNSFVRLELNLSNGSSYQCQPMSGHQMII
jgi:type VI secretion system protein ImpG